MKKYKYLIILPDDNFKTLWEFITSFLLVFLFFVAPYWLAFTVTDSLTWIIIDEFIDFMFFIDIILNFFSAYYEKFVLVDKWTKIACKYIKTWFLIDLVCIIPFNMIFSNSANYGKLVRLTWISKMYWLVKMIRLLKMIKVQKNNKILSSINKLLKSGIAIERIMFFLLLAILFVHLFTCLWVLILDLEDNELNWLVTWNL